MKQLKQAAKSLWQDESAQGMAEYALLLVVVVAIAFIFKGRIMKIVEGKMDSISEDIGGFTSH